VRSDEPLGESGAALGRAGWAENGGRGVGTVEQQGEFVALWFTLAFERGYGRQTGFKILTR
jgi:hypothetical protein